MKNFAKYITQGIGMAIGVIVIFIIVISGVKVKNNITNYKMEKQLEQIAVVQAQKKIDKEKLLEMGLAEEEINNALNNGVDIDEVGEYTINVISGKGDVYIYDMLALKKIKTIDTVNSNKVSTFQGDIGYKIVPEVGLIIDCIKK